MDTAEKNCDVAIVNGNIRFTSRSRLQASSAVAIATGGGTTILGAGTVPAADVNTASEYDETNTSNIMWDNGDGLLNRTNGGRGTINYGPCGGTAAGELYITGCPANANAKMTFSYNSTVGGEVTMTTPANDGKVCNALVGVYARAQTKTANNSGGGGRNGKLRLMVIDNGKYDISL